MRGACVYYMGKNRHPSKNYYDKSVTIHARNMQILATEMFKVYRNISPSISSEIFHRRYINYNLRINSEFAMQNLRSFVHEIESISCLGPKIWDIVP